MNFYIDVGNNGPDVSEDTKLTFSDNMFDLTFESVSYSKGELDEVLPVWNIGTLEVGEEATIDFEGIRNETGEDITLTATISGSNFDPNSENNVLVKIIEKSSQPVGFVIKTTDGAVLAIEGTGTVPGTDVYVNEDGQISGGRLEEVLSFPEEKPDWLEGNGIWFYGAENLTKVPDTLPTWITDMDNMFTDCTNFNGDISGWDVSNVTTMFSMFNGCSSFNQDISGWDVSNVTNMRSMFQKCTSFNQDLSGWDVSSVTSMYGMFSRCSSFNGDLSEWDTSNVIDMYTMFYECSSFNGDISGWDVSNVENMTMMFTGCSSFNQDLSGWCVSNFLGEPFNFSNNTPSWTLPKPVWGTCPQGDSGDSGEGVSATTTLTAGEFIHVNGSTYNGFSSWEDRGSVSPSTLSFGGIEAQLMQLEYGDVSSGKYIVLTLDGIQGATSAIVQVGGVDYLLDDPYEEESSIELGNRSVSESPFVNGGVYEVTITLFGDLFSVP